MDYTIFLNVIKSHAYHCENTKNILFWQKLLWVFFYDTFKTFIALFHYYAREVCFVFNNVNYLTNEWVILQFKHSDFSFGLRLYNTLSKYGANLKLESFSGISFPINIRLDLEDCTLSSCFYDFYRLKIIVYCPKP